MASLCTCEKTHIHGSFRSLVRRIGSRLPIRTGKRLYIRVPGADSPSVQATESEFRYEATGQRYIPNEEGLTLASYIDDPRQLFSKATGLLDFDPVEGEGVEVAEEEEEMGVAEGAETHGQEAMDKISALESELAKLKAQIAVYALSEDMEEDSEAPVPPPPPPIPPPPSAPSQQVLRGSSTDGPLQPFLRTPVSSRGPPQSAEFLSTPVGRPDMADMLRDIGSVKLRTVNAAKSPGGTPLRPKNKGGREADPNDPASIIAHALRKKFSHRVFKDSPDKENLDRSDASINLGFESPTGKFLKK